jgi:hypothetical protein
MLPAMRRFSIRAELSGVALAESTVIGSASEIPPERGERLGNQGELSRPVQTHIYRRDDFPGLSVDLECLHKQRAIFWRYGDPGGLLHDDVSVFAGQGNVGCVQAK